MPASMTFSVLSSIDFFLVSIDCLTSSFGSSIGYLAYVSSSISDLGVSYFLTVIAPPWNSCVAVFYS